MECYSAFEGNSAICDNIEAVGHYTKLKKPDRERQILMSHLYMESKISQAHRCRE